MEEENNEKKKNNWPADLYLEGSDQFRGWFNSSLITSTILSGTSPYRQVLAHGFVVDERGKKMSKSLGNVIDPEEMRQKFGADVLRLWVTTADFTKEIKVSEEILQRVQENYQKIRNTCRFLLGNLQYLEKKEELENELRVVDYWILNKLENLTKYSEEKYKEYEFNAVYSSLLSFCVDNLSSFYFETSKDSLYCDALSTKRRRQIITTLYYLLGGLLKIITPILPFLAEEIYQHLPFKFGYAQEESVMLASSLAFSFPSNKKDVEIIDSFLFLRQDVFLALEKARQEKLINTGFQAIVLVIPKQKENANHFSLLNLAELLSVAKLEFLPSIPEEEAFFWEEGKNYWVKIEKNPAERCLRCWNYENLENNFCLRCRKILTSR